jgi:hypothetical protein
MTLFLIMAAALTLVSFPQHNPLPPGYEKVLVWTDVEELDCHEPAAPASTLEDIKPTRTANFRIFGIYECRRPIFSADERNSYIEIVLQAETSKAKRIALKLQKEYLHTTKSSAPIGIQVSGGPEPELRKAVAALYRSELLQVLGPGSVRRLVMSENLAEVTADSAPLLLVRLHRVDSPELVSRVSIVTGGVKGEVQWREL